jgi:hypothetical protein
MFERWFMTKTTEALGGIALSAASSTEPSRTR